jgi:hypothetical protein
MKTKLLGCLAATVIGAASVIATPATAFRGGGGFGGGGFRGGMVTGRSAFVPGPNRFVGAPFAGRHAFVNRRFFDEGRRDRFEDRFRHRRFFANGLDNFAFIGVSFAYDYAAYGNGCWRQVWTPYGWQWSNICYDYGDSYGY